MFLLISSIISVMTILDNQIRQLSQDEIDQCCRKELTFLESLAFNAMESNTIIIRPSLLKKALAEAKVSLQETPHILNIGILKSFNKQGTGNRIQMNNDHYFVHLSFQEYFAARYLINALEVSQTQKAVEFIKHQKYNHRYALVFSFAAGLLSETDTRTCINIFWNNILGEPLDLVGIRHMQLVISCIEATSGKPTIPRRTELLAWIAECIEHNISTKTKIILNQLTQSLQRAQSVVCDKTIQDAFTNLLQSNDTDTKAKVLSFISNLKISNPPITLITFVTTRLDDENEQVRENASKALGTMGEKAATNEVISKLVNALGHENFNVRWHACEALCKMGEKAATDEVISKLVSAVGDERSNVRSCACYALGKMGEKAAMNEVISKLMSALGDENFNVRRDACEALGKMGEKAATNEVISKLVTALGDKNFKVRANACEALGKMGEKVATNEVISKLVSALGDEDQYVSRNACEALRKMGEKAATNEVISKLVSALGDKNGYIRANACEALGKMGEKAATNEVISKLVSALGEENESVRVNACIALGRMGEKAGMHEVISNLMSALGDESDSVRGSACEALGKMGEKAATNEVISKLVSALGDKNGYIRANACKALGKMGEKAATNEVISKRVSALGDRSGYARLGACEALVPLGEKAATNERISKLAGIINTDSWNSSEAASSVGNILSSTAVIMQLDPSIVASLCLCKYASDCLKNIAEDELIKWFLNTQNSDCLPTIANVTLLKGAAVTSGEKKVVVYSSKEPLEVSVANSELARQLIEALADQRKRWHLYFDK